MSKPFRCAADSVALAEPLAGTASTVRPFLLLEFPGPWGVDAMRDGRLPVGVAAELDRRCAGLGVRPLLIRRHGRSRTDGIRCFAAYAHPQWPWLEATTLQAVDEVLDLDLDRLSRGESLGLQQQPDPVFLVCTHGRHDACCAELGRPIAAALTASHPAQTWECSHIGGDRFAGNILVLPDGLYYGRADRESAPRIAKTHLEGHLDLDHLRGRAGFGFATQAAEWHLRRHLGVTDLAEVRLVEQHVRDDVTEVILSVTDGAHWRVRIRTLRGAPHQLTCQSRRPRRPLQFELVALDTHPSGEPT